MGTIFYKTLKALFHVLLGLVLGKKSLHLEKNALTELHSMSHPILRKMLYPCSKGWGVQQLYIRWIKQMNMHLEIPYILVGIAAIRKL